MSGASAQVSSAPSGREYGIGGGVREYGTGSANPLHGGYGGRDGGEEMMVKPQQRKRLELQPRSAKGVAAANNRPENRRSSKNPFGAARPREEVLASKGIDAKLVDARIQRKASSSKFSKEQELELDSLRAQIAEIEAARQDANERELPEEHFRLAAEEKKKELLTMTSRFVEDNMKKQDEVTTNNTYPSGTTRRSLNSNNRDRTSDKRNVWKSTETWKQAGNGDNAGDHNADDAYASFGRGRRNYYRNTSGREGDMYHD